MMEYPVERKENEKNRNYVLTPYQHATVPSVTKEEKPLSNYDPYDLFALKTKLMPLVVKMNPLYTLDFAPIYMKGDYWQQAAYLKDAGIVVILNESDRNKLKKEIEKRNDDEYCLIYDPEVFVNLDLPLTWLQSMTPYIYHLLQPFQCKIEGHKVYIILDRFEDYEDKWNALNLLISNQLKELYEGEATILSKEEDEEEIEERGLQLYDSLDSDLGLYVL